MGTSPQKGIDVALALPAFCTSVQKAGETPTGRMCIQAFLSTKDKLKPRFFDIYRKMYAMFLAGHALCV